MMSRTGIGHTFSKTPCGLILTANIHNSSLDNTETCAAAVFHQIIFHLLLGDRGRERVGVVHRSVDANPAGTTSAFHWKDKVNQLSERNLDSFRGVNGFPTQGALAAGIARLSPPRRANKPNRQTAWRHRPRLTYFCSSDESELQCENEAEIEAIAARRGRYIRLASAGG